MAFLPRRDRGCLRSYLWLPKRPVLPCSRLLARWSWARLSLPNLLILSLDQPAIRAISIILRVAPVAVQLLLSRLAFVRWRWAPRLLAQPFARLPIVVL